MKPGDVFVSERGRRVTVLEVAKAEVLFEIERDVKGKDDKRKVETRQRSVARNDIPIFLLAYKKES